MDKGAKRSRTVQNGDGAPHGEPQFPKQAGLAHPFNIMPKRWINNAVTQADAESKFYDKGTAKQDMRRVPIGPGGDGRVVSSKARHPRSAARKAG